MIIVGIATVNEKAKGHHNITTPGTKWLALESTYNGKYLLADILDPNAWGARFTVNKEFCDIVPLTKLQYVLYEAQFESLRK
jgi:hypothetical protein